MIDFKGSQYPKDVILYAVFFYVRYAVSYRDLEEIMEERGVEVDHATLNRWVVKYCDAKAARHFFKQAINTNDVPDKVVIDKCGANFAGLLWTNVMLKFEHGSKLIKILQVKYLNNIVEQDHRFIKKLTCPFATPPLWVVLKLHCLQLAYLTRQACHIFQ